jgi:SNF2 family DNA or RNA helicase
MSTFLHAAFGQGQLWLWGETAAETAAPLPKRRRRKSGQPYPPSNPFDAGAEALDHAAEVLGLASAGINLDRVVLWLPTVDGRPIASNPIVEEIPASVIGVEIAPWETAALALAPAAFADLLTGRRDDGILASGLFASSDLAFWHTVLRFAGALVARQSVLPGIKEENGGPAARWQPVLLGRDAQAVARLAHAIPDAARAVGEATAPPPDPPATVVGEVIGLLVDALMRSDASAARTAMLTTLDDRWLAALSGTNAELRGDAAEVEALRQRLEEWRRPIAVAASSPSRLCFRIEEPTIDLDSEDPGPIHVPDAPWRVRFLLQAHADPSLLLPVREAWSGRDRALSKLVGSKANVREFLLLSFAQAGRISPAVEASLKRGLPDGIETDAAGAVDFLVNAAPGLELSGFGVMLPSWWTRQGTRTRLTTRAKVRAPKMQGGSGVSLETIVRFDWEVALGDQTLSRQDLMALAKLKAPLVRVRGQWVLLDPSEIKDVAHRLQQRGATAAVRDVVRMALGGTDDAEPAAVSAEGWIKDLLDRLAGRSALKTLSPPSGLNGTLRPYQSRGYSWLVFLRRWQLGACLADDMGLGKTVQTLALLLHDKDSSHETPSVLLVCPTSVIGNWQREAARFAPGLKVLVHHGIGRLKTGTLRKACLAHDLVITSYALLQREVDALKSVPWIGVVLDEAQNIKNPETKQAKAARALDAGYRVVLTGTPVENNIGDLWSIMEFLNPGFLGTQAGFKRRYFEPIQTRRDPGTIAHLKALTGPFILRRLKTDKAVIDDLPEKQEMKVYCPLTKEQASLYAAVVEESLRALEGADGIRRRGVVLATLSKLKQVCNHPAQFLADGSAVADRSGKLARLTEMLEEVFTVGDRALVFTQFTAMGSIIKTHLEETFGREVLFLHGRVAKAKRDRMVDHFQQPDGPRIFLLSLKAGGTGLNLTAANHVFHYDRWWNPAVERQATDRAFRIGQTRQVQVHKFLCLGTLEEKIDEMIETKRVISEAIVGTGERWLTELSTDDLRDLLALRQEAVA